MNSLQKRGKIEAIALIVMITINQIILNFPLTIVSSTGSSSWITWESNLAYSSQDLETITSNFDATFSLLKEFSGKVRFRIWPFNKIKLIK